MSTCPASSFVNLAIGFGVSAERIVHANRLEPALRESFAAAAPTLLDVWVDPTVERLY